MTTKTAELAFQFTLPDSYDDAIEKVTAALKVEGFGVLTRIDVRTTLKEKIGADFRPYVILGACNPKLAHRALQSEPMIGTLLPCNVTVETTDGGTQVTIINPDAMLGLPPLSDNETVVEVASEARARLQRVAESLQAG